MLRELFGVDKPAEWTPVELPRLLALLSEAARAVESRPPDPELLFARLCDTYRAMDFDPPKEAWTLHPPPWPEVAEKLKRPFTEEDWKRIHLLVDSLGEKSIWELVRQRCVEWGTERTTALLFVAFAKWADLLTIPLLLKSVFRVEEFARKWVEVLGGAIAGEKEKDSHKRIRNLDYGNVLENLQKAQKAREAHRKRLEEIEAKRRQEEYERTQRE